MFWAAKGVNADCHRLNFENSWLMRTSCNSMCRAHGMGSLYQPSGSQPSAPRSVSQLVLAGSCSGNRFDFWQKRCGHRPSLVTLNTSMQRLVCCLKAALLASHSLFGFRAILSFHLGAPCLLWRSGWAKGTCGGPPDSPFFFRK